MVSLLLCVYRIRASGSEGVMSVLVWNLSQQGFGSRWGEIVRSALTLRRDLGVWKLSLLSNLPAFTTRRLLLADRWYITFYCSHLLWLAFSPDTHSLCFSLFFPSLPYRWHSNTHTETESFHSDISTTVCNMLHRAEKPGPKTHTCTALCNSYRYRFIIFEISQRLRVSFLSYRQT